MHTASDAGYLIRLGVVDYAEAWALQRCLAAAREAERQAKGVRVYHVDRGGDITYHGPGQLVGYPIMYLGRPSQDGRLPQVAYVGYLRRLEEVLIHTLAAWDVAAVRSLGYTSVWVQAGERVDGPVKVAAIGVKVDGRGVSQHGFALNVSSELNCFRSIVPCGIHDRDVTSMSQLLDRRIDLDEVAATVAERFSRVFALRWQRIQLDELTVRDSEFQNSRIPESRSAPGAHLPWRAVPGIAPTLPSR